MSLHCAGTPGESCKLVLTLKATETVKSSARHKHRKKVVVLASATATLSAGHSRTVKLALNGTGKRLLRARHKLRTTLTIKKRIAATAKLVSTRRLTFRSAAKRRTGR